MKGLFIKDIRLMMNQKQFFGAVLIMTIVFMSIYTNPDFVICYITIMFSVFTLSTISYDKYDNGLSYLFTLPVSRKGYVTEKYIFGFALTALGFAVISGLSFVMNGVRHIEYDIKEWAVTGISCLLIITILFAVNVPLQLKFEANKSQVAMMATFAGAFFVAYLAVKICETWEIDLEDMINRAVEMNFMWCVIGVCVFWAVGMLISYLAAVRIMEKREF